MDSDEDYCSEKITIKQEPINDYDDNCTVYICDKKDIKEELIKRANNDLTEECELKDHFGQGYFKFVAPEDIKEEDTNVAATEEENISDPISIKEGMYTIIT